MLNIKLTLAYDGSAYLGWQKTPMGPSIEAALQRAIEQILQHPAPLQAASRTDAGVHAEGQTVNFFTPKPHLDLGKFQFSLNRLLPQDIAILKAERMPITFHPTIQCIAKEYRYCICLGPIQLPRYRLTSWHVPYRLDLEMMREALGFLTGTHDFGVFCTIKKITHYTDTIRTVQLLEFDEIDRNRLLFRIIGTHFLYKMVRNIVGTLVDIGRGKIPLEQLPLILKSRHRPHAGVTAPAHGLFLHEVFY